MHDDLGCQGKTSVTVDDVVEHRDGHRIDHLVYATPDLAAGVAHIARLLGADAAAGRPAPWSRNAECAPRPWGRALTSRLWVRIPTSQPPPEPRWFGTIRLPVKPRLVTWAAAVADSWRSWRVELAQAGARRTWAGRTGPTDALGRRHTLLALHRPGSRVL